MHPFVHDDIERRRQGETMLALSRRVCFSPVLLARLMMETILEIPKKSVADFVRCDHYRKNLDSRTSVTGILKRCPMIACTPSKAHYAHSELRLHSQSARAR